MIKMLNQVFLQGRLGKDPELRHTSNGRAVASVSLAVDRDYKSQGSDSRETDWFTVVAWGSTAEFVQKYFTKGRVMIVAGRLQVRKWTDRDGNKRNSTEIIADNIYFGDSKKDGGQSSDYSNQNNYSPQEYDYAPGEFSDISANEDDLPF